MPGDRHMDPTVRAARYEYQLGLDREPAEDWRSPRVGRGDPATCNALERASRFGNPSTEFILGWEEWLADVLLIACASSYVEDCLMVGVPPNHYAYTLIPHDETRKNLPPTCTRVMRSAVHGKIENVRLPTGGYLQPFYGPKTRLLTCLFLAKWSIENNWSFGLDPGRERNVVPSRQPTKLSIFKAFIEKKVKAAKRCSDGKPDPVAILDVLYEIGIDEIETAKGYAGRRGVRFHFEDHPKPVLFFGEQYMALHDYLREKHINEIENRTDNKPSAWEQYFPGGQLIRTEEYTSRIAVGLQQCLDARAKFNIERYNLNRPIFVMGGLVVGDVNRGGGGPDVLDGSDVRAKSGVEGPTGGCPGSQDAKCGKAGRPLTIEVRKEGQLDDSGTSHLSPEVSGSHCDKAAKDLTGGNAGEPLAPGMPFDLVLPMASQESDTKTETSDRASASPGPPCPIPAAPIEASMMGIEKLPCPGDGADGLRRAKEANGRSAATSATGKSDEPVASKGPSNDEQPMSHQTEEYVSENLPAKVKPNRGGKYVTPCPKQDGSPDLCLVQGMLATASIPHHPSQQVPDAIIPCAPIFAWRVDKVDPIPCFDQSDANPEQTGATFSNPYENDSTNTKPSEKQHPDPCGARTAVGINPDSVATVVARALREILRAIEQLQIGINAFVEELRRSTRGLIDADHRLGVQGQQLDQAIEQHSPEAAALDDTRDDECPTLLGTREFLRRVKKPASPILRALPSPKVEQIDPSHNI